MIKKGISVILIIVALSVVFSMYALSGKSAQAQDKGFVIAGSKDPAESMASIKGTRWALLVGIANYPSVEGFAIQQLKAPVKDVNALAAFLKNPEGGGFDADHVLKLTDNTATRRNILMNFNDIARRAAPEDMVIFYFSGHGVPDSESGETYLVPYDHDLSDLGTTCINFHDLAQKIRMMKASKVVVILDACHSSGIKPEGARGTDTTRGELTELYAQEFERAEGRALLLSSDESEVSWETEDCGIFTRFLLEGLSGKADNDDDGIVTFTEAAEYVEVAVPKYTRENFPREQQPWRRYLADKARGAIPLAINRRKVIRQRQQDLLLKRNAAIYRAGLDEDLREFSLRMAKSAHDMAISDQQETEQESLLLGLLLQQIDKLKDGDTTAADYALRAAAIRESMLTRLRITVTPADATVKLSPANEPSKIISPSSPDVYKLEQGQYRLFVEREGYKPYSQELTLTQASRTVTVALERLMGTLQVRVEPADATVMVTPLSILAPDAEFKPSKPISIGLTGGKELPIGTYRVTAEKEGYESAIEEPIEIKTSDNTLVTLVLTQEPAMVIAPNLPYGTRVLVNGEFVELPYKLRPGIHRIRLERDGFQPVEGPEELEPAQVLSLGSEWIPVTPSLAGLRIAVAPAGARATLAPVNEPSKIISPSSPNFYQIQRGQYHLSVQEQGYATYSQDLTLDQASRTVTVALERLMGTLQLQVEPANAMVIVTPLSIPAPDTEIRELEPIRVQPTGGRDLPIGTYRVAASKEGYESAFKEPVEIKASISTLVTLKLRPERIVITPPPLTQLQIKVTPADAEVALAPVDAPDQTVSPSSPNSYRVQRGQYRLSAQRPGYASYSRDLTLNQESQSVTVNLVERLTGTLQLQVAPADATVMVTPLSIPAPDNEIRPSKPIRVEPTGEKELPIGIYRVVAEKEGLEPAVKESVEIKVNARVWVTLNLKPIKQNPATIVAPDLPGGTRVLIDGQFVALPYELTPGTHRIRLERDGFHPVEMYKALEPMQVLSLRPEWVPIMPSSRSRWKAALKSTVMPGWGDLPDRKVSGIFMGVVQLGTLAGALLYQSDYTKKMDEYEDEYEKCKEENFRTYPEYKAQYELTQSKLRDANDSKMVRNVLFASAVLGVRAIGALESALFMSRAEGQRITSSMENGEVTLAWRHKF